MLLLLSVSSFAATLSSIDPSSSGASARALGMGGMFLNVQGDPASVINNPAGLAKIDRWKFFSMGTKTLQEINYYTVGTAFPIQNVGVMGIALVDRSIKDIPITGPLIISGGTFDDSNIDSATFSEDTLFLTYANTVLLWERDVNYGISTKFFQKRTSNYDEGNASGINMDLGMQLEINKDLSTGLKIQNIFGGSADSAAAGSMVWDTGEYEKMDSYFCLGIANKTLYKNLLLGLDIKKNLSRQAYPALIALGSEWHPYDQLFLRCGLEQSIKAPDINDGGEYAAVVNNYTLGIGTNLDGWRFDYAFRPNSEIKDLTAHVFSISYVGPEPCEKVSADEIMEDELVSTSSVLYITFPEDRLVTTAVSILVQGKVVNSDRYILNGEEYQVETDGTFSREVVLALGINDITLAVPQSKQKLIRKVLRLADFKDIGDSNYKTAIVNIATLGYLQGDYPDIFNPKRFVTRAEMAALIIKINRFRLPLSMKGMWNDVDILASQGILKGFPDGLMRQDEKLTRAQVAMVLSRLENLPEPEVQPAGYLNKAHWAENSIQALADTKLYAPEDFEPRNEFVTKEELAELFSRLPSVQANINKLLNFDESGSDENLSKQIDTIFMKRGGQDSSTDTDMFNQMIGTAKVADTTVPLTNPDFHYQELLLKETVSAIPKGTVGKLPEITIYAPPDKTIVYRDLIVLKGTVANANKLYVNNVAVPLNKESFYYQYKLKPGKNLVVIKALNKEGKFKRVERKVLRLKNFVDIKDTDPDKKTICGLATLGYLTGDKNGYYYPAQPVDKLVYAGMLQRIYALPVNLPAQSPYKDLSAKSWGFRSAYALDAANILNSEKSFYKPAAPVTRAFAAVILTRIEKIAPDQSGAKVYTDVDESSWAYKHIAAAKQAGLLPAAKNFKPEEKLDKKTAAVILACSRPVKAKLSNLLDWEQGY